MILETIALAALSSPAKIAQVPGSRYSVVIGCKLPKFDALQFTLIDAKLMADRLSPGGDCKLILSDQATKPTKKAVMSAIAQQAAKCGPKDTFWFYWSGHGDKLGDKSYLLNYDCDPFDVRTMVSITEIRELLKGCKARAKVLVLDACHSGSTKRMPGTTAAIDRVVSQFKGQATMAACQLEQTALESPELGHGLFTFFLVRGLAGEAAKNGTITLNNLRDYTVQQVSGFAEARGHRQMPQFLFDGSDGNQAVAVPAAAGDIPPAPPASATVAPVKPLPPGVVVLVKGEDRGATSSLRTSLKMRLLNKGLPVLADELSDAFQSTLAQAGGEDGNALEQWRARFLARAEISTEARPMAETQNVISVAVTINGELVDAFGSVKHAFRATATSVGATATAATERALKKAMDSFAGELEANVARSLEK